MNAAPVFSWLNTPAWLPLIHALLHTLWQGALAAAGLFAALRFVPARFPRLRYGLSAAALAALVLAGVGTWALLDVPRSPSQGRGRGGQAEAAVRSLGGPFSAAPAVLPAPSGKVLTVSPVGSTDALGSPWWVRWTAAGWLLGVTVSLWRAVAGTLGAGRLRRRCRALTDPPVLALAEGLRARLGVARRVRFLVCDEIGVPSVLGLVCPAVLLPASLLTGVPVEQLRAILAHELAHIRRWDYLANLVQMWVEALLFFNPFVWWISRQVWLEREACCDRVAAAECPSPAGYVEALVAVLERGRATVAPPLLAAGGSGAPGGNTLERARRLLVPGYQPALRVRWFSLAAVFAVAMFASGGVWLGTRAVAQTIRTTGENVAPEPPPDAGQVLPPDALAAARGGDAKQALALLESAFKPKKFGAEDAARVLDDLVRQRELAAFTTLHDQLKRTGYGKDWKPTDAGLASLVKDGRTDFLDALLALRLDPVRLQALAPAADAPTADWITRRTAEVAKQRADLEALEKAAADDDLPALGRLVDAGAEVNGVGRDDNTPLIRAVFKNRLEAAQWLLDHGAQVDQPRFPGWDYTPLCLAKSVPMAELLKKNGANVHAKLYERDVSILTYAVMWAKGDVVAWFLQQGLDANMIGDNQENLLFGLKDGTTAEALLEAGTDPNHADESGRTPLTAAHSAEVVRALVRHGANLHPQFKDGATLLEHAVNSIGREDDTPEQEAACIEELIKQGAEFDPQGNGVRAMLSAAFLDRVGEVRAFLDHGVSPAASYAREPSEYRSALSSAAMQAPKSLKLLLERGANPNAPFPADQATPLEGALGMGAFHNVDLLLQAGAKGLSDLAYASARGDAAKVGELLDRHADPNEANSSGWTPLHYAVRHGQAAVARQLLDHGASVDRFDAWGFTPYLYFVLSRKLIEEDPKQARTQWRLPPQEAKARLAALQQLFTQHPPDFAYRNNEGRTALHQAAWGGSSTALGMMLEEKPPRCDPNLPDKEGRTALLLAALSPEAKVAQGISAADDPEQKNSQVYVAEELLKAGARLDLVVADGRTVGELALAAAHAADNAQLAAVLTDAMQGRPVSGSSPAAPAPVDDPQP